METEAASSALVGTAYTLVPCAWEKKRMRGLSHFRVKKKISTVPVPTQRKLAEEDVGGRREAASLWKHLPITEGPR